MEQVRAENAILEGLEKDLAEVERNRNALIGAIEYYRVKAGLPPRPGHSGEPRQNGEDAGTATSVVLQHDTFFGKRASSSARQFLEMRRSANQGPARTKEIFEALKQGGYQFDTKDDDTAQASLRGMLNKYTTIFQKLPNGTYGLKTWYPDAKPRRATGAKAAAQEEAEEPDGADEAGDATAEVSGSPRLLPAPKVA